MMTRRPVMHQLSLISFTMAIGAILLLPLAVWEYSRGITLKLGLMTMTTLIYVVVFASTLAYLFFNRGIVLIGPKPGRAVPASGSCVRLDHGDPAAWRRAVAVSSRRICPGTRGRRDCFTKGIGGQMKPWRRTADQHR